MTTFRVGHYVRHIEIDDRVVILDFCSGAYLAFDPVASLMWRHVVAADGRQKTLTSLTEKYKVDRPRLEHDYDAFVRRCLDQRLLVDTDMSDDGEIPQPVPTQACYRTARQPLSVRAWWSLWRTSRRLSKAGFFNTYQQLAQRISRQTADDDAPRRLELGVKTFARAENFFHLKRAPQDCLPRSLALFDFLRSLGLRVEHRIGVQMFPFLAHAWVQYGDRVVHDDPNNPSRFTTIASIPA